MKQVQLSARASIARRASDMTARRGRKAVSLFRIWRVAVTEVEVDGYTGMKRIRAVDIILHDARRRVTEPGRDAARSRARSCRAMGWLTGEESRSEHRTESSSLTLRARTKSRVSATRPSDADIEPLPHAAQAGVIHGSKAVVSPAHVRPQRARGDPRRDRRLGAAGGEIPLGCPATHEAIRAVIRTRLDDESNAVSVKAASRRGRRRVGADAEPFVLPSVTVHE